MTEASTTPESNTLEVDDLDQFVKILTGWHDSKVKMLQHMTSIPEGTVMTTEAGVDLELTGKFLDGFRAGIGLALMELGILPFTAEPEPQASNEHVAG